MAKSPKLDLFEKLSELKAWQSKQQEKLLAQQNEQQSILKRQQRQEMDLFDSRKTEVIEPQNRPVNMRGQLNDPICRDRDITALRCEDSGRTEEDIDTVNKPVNVSLEDMPVKSPIVDFEKLLERKLKEIGSNAHEGNEQINNVKPKRQFLKKGEGLKRFNMKSHNEFVKNKAANTNIEPQIRKRISNATIQNRNTANCRTSNSKSKEEVMADARLDPQPLPKHRQSATWSSVLDQEGQGCSTKLDRMCKHEAEDLKVFELLEQMAVDSSFCSTSSTLLGFMESPVISTPLKAILEHRKQLKDLKSPKHLPFGMDLSDEETEDFATSSESCSSENETVEGKVNDAPGSSRVRFCNLVEEREFDAGHLTQKSSLNAEDDFEDTEVWSDSDVESDESTPLTVSNKPTAVEKQEESRTIPVSEKDIPSCSTPGMTRNENGNDSSKIILKSELLHRRLLELEKEIETFRKENEQLFLKKQLQQQAEEKWLKEKKEIEKRLREKEEELKNKALDERQKLSREKRVFETYSKKMGEKASNHQGVEILQKKLTELQLELREKERKSAASYNRISNRVKVLEKENSELKEEIEKWKKEKQMESRKSTSGLFGSRKSVGNTKALHRINDELTRVPPVAKEAAKSKSSVKIEPLKASEERMKSEDAEMESGVSLQRIRQKSYSEEDAGDGRPELISDEASTDRADSIPQISGDCQIMGRQSSSAEAAFRTPSTFLSEKLNSDGSQEIRYENGNFKKISPDGLNIKLFYFNGDVKETLSDGTIKYYYSETRTWHTTFSDGLEILEFPNGQVERHFQGTVEVAFPDGTVRIIQGDGREELRLPDGTNVVTDTNGDKIISFPNGQKEYQTNDFKKRVYPDGTMKIVYSDGVQETRYSNGRVRLRDAAGSLLMDSES